MLRVRLTPSRPAGLGALGYFPRRGGMVVAIVLVARMNTKTPGPVAADYMTTPVVTVERQRSLPDVDRAMQS